MRRRCIAVAAALAVAGCGSGGASAGDLRDAADESAKQRSARVEILVAAGEGQEVFRFEGTGPTTVDGARSRLTGTLEPPGEKPLDIELIAVGEEYWMRIPALSLPRGKRWIHGVDESPAAITLAEFLAMVRQADDLEEVGEEDVHGRTTTHFKGRLSLAELLERLPEVSRERFEPLTEAFEDDDVELPLEAWIDADGLVRRILVFVGDADRHLSFRADMLEYGVEVDTARPPARQVIEETEALP